MLFLWARRVGATTVNIMIEVMCTRTHAEEVLILLWSRFLSPNRFTQGRWGRNRLSAALVIATSIVLCSPSVQIFDRDG